MRQFLSPYVLTVLLGFGAVALTTQACTPQLHIATLADTGLVDALHQAKIAEAQAYAVGLYGLSQHRQTLHVLIDVDTDALALTDALVAWHDAGSDVHSLPALISSTQAAIRQLLTDLNAQPPTSPLVRALQGILVFLK